MRDTDTNRNFQSAEIERTVDVVSAYVTNNVVPPSELPNLIATVHAALTGLAFSAAPVEKPTPAISIKRSVQPDHIVCLECGKPFKSLKRHLTAIHQMTADEYRAKWGLAADYPLVAPEYAKQRSALAVSLGLGRTNSGKRRKAGGRK